jgi:hypothetical protein
MSDSVLMEGNEYISSKRAAELCGYAQDYIGQLARSGKIEARRAAGHWYVNIESLKQHTKNADAHVPQTRLDVEIRSVDTIAGDDGVDYVSASRASKISGYHQDYIGQLARSSMIRAQQVGNRWYIDLTQLLSHKQVKDGLLAAVQTASVGLSRESIDRHATPPGMKPQIHYTYHHIESPLMPVTTTSHAAASDDQSSDIIAEQATRIPIRIHRRVSSGHGTHGTDSSFERREITKKILVGTATAGILSVLLVTLLVPHTLQRSDGGKSSTASVATLVEQPAEAKKPLTPSSTETEDGGPTGLSLILDRIRSIVTDRVSYAR